MYLAHVERLLVGCYANAFACDLTVADEQHFNLVCAVWNILHAEFSVAVAHASGDDIAVLVVNHYVGEFNRFVAVFFEYSAVYYAVGGLSVGTLCVYYANAEANGSK